MKNNPLISVLIPVYNVEKYVERCILSVLNQTMQEGVEVIIVNDCTPDSSMDIIAKVLNTYSDKYSHDTPMKIHIINHDKNRGLAAARNTAISHATGDYIVQVDSDDYIEPEMLATMYNKATEENADIVICDYYIQFTHHKVLCKQTYIEKDIYFGEIIAGYHTSLWNKMIKKELYDKYSIKCIEGLDCGEDYIVLLPIMYYASQIVYIPSAFYNYVKINPNSITKKMTKKVIQNIFHRIEYANQFVIKHNLKQHEKNLAHLILSDEIRLLEASLTNEYKELSILYPKANEYLASYLKETSLYNRLILNRHFRIAQFLRTTKNILKRILRKY